jgi:GNAT superfamily N-acetyltransferase
MSPALSEIEPYAPSHRAGVVALILPIQTLEFGIPVTLEDQPDLSDIEGFYRRGAGNFWVATAAGQVVGTIGLLDIGQGRAALRKMFVAAPWRGAPNAVAARLLATLLEWCEQRALSELFLGTTAQFLAAHRFYEKHGFREIARASLPAEFPIMRVDSKFYTRTLGAGTR